MTGRLNGGEVEDLAAALLEQDGYRTHVAKPERRRIQDGHVVEYGQQYDLLGDWDVLAVHPDEGIRLVQVTRDEENVSEKLAQIAERRPKYPVERHSSPFWFWVWNGARFRMHVLNSWDGYGWELSTSRRVESPRTVLNRADTHLDQEASS